MSSTTTPFAGLTPDLILDAVDAAGFTTTGSLLELNSYENRVYQVELEDGTFLVPKFYRPGRWTDAQILEEHAFSTELKEAELPVVAPLDRDGTTLFHHAGFRYALFPRQGGHAPNLEDPENLRVLARTLARMHALGAVRPFETRPTLSVARLGRESREFVMANGFVPLELEQAYASVTAHLLERCEQVLLDLTCVRIHGDCHPGNLLWRGDGPHFVDFDDCVNGPPIQDLWMLLSGEREEREAQLGIIVPAYETFADFDDESLRWIEALRTLRILHHAGWIARRWDDPAFPRAFPGFDSMRYWSNHILALREQQSALEEPVLRVP